MCVAALIEGPDVPLKHLLAMERENPHGAGVGFPDGNRLRYVKGLTAKQIDALQKSLPRPFLLHFRWATHGPRSGHLCHPFPLGPRVLVSEQLEGTAGSLLIHNGTWGEYRRHLPDWAVPRLKRLSDTAVAAYVAEKDESILDDVQWATALMRARGNNRVDVTLRGRWFDHDGNVYSNLNWIPREYPTCSPYGAPYRPYDPGAKPCDVCHHYKCSCPTKPEDQWSFEEWLVWAKGDTSALTPDERALVDSIELEPLTPDVPVCDAGVPLNADACGYCGETGPHHPDCIADITDETQLTTWFDEQAAVQRALQTMDAERRGRRP